MASSVLDPPPAPAQAAPAPSAPITLTSFEDLPALRQSIFDKAKTAAGGIQPVENARYKLSLHDVDYTGPERFTKAHHKQALLTNGTLGRRLQGTWKLTDKSTGKEVAKHRATLATIPYLTDLGTFVNNGSDMTLAHQLRLRPGAFTRIKENGELENHVNVQQGTGVSHRIFMDPDTGVFRMQLGAARLPLISLLKGMGLSDTQLRQEWGNELAAANMAKQDPHALGKLHERLLRRPGGDPEATAKTVTEAFQNMRLDPEVTKRTLGGPYDRLDAKAYLRITKKLMAVNRGEEEPDDRDATPFQQLVGPADLFAERLAHSRGMLNRLLWRATSKGNLNHVNAGALQYAVSDTLLNSGLGQNPEEVNPLELLDNNTRVTRMGVGGIPSADSVPAEARGVQPTQLGFIDYLRTPESSRVGVDLRLARGARRGSDGKLYAPVKDARTGQVVYKSPQELTDSTVAFPGELETGNSNFVSALDRGKPDTVERRHVQYSFPHAEEHFSPLGTLIPLKSTVKGQRAVMASRMLGQALPLVDGEAPFVQNAMPGRPDHSYEEEYGKRMGAVFAKQPGTVVGVSPDSIRVRYLDGKEEDHELYNAHPFNRKTSLTQTPTVAVGQTFQPGQLLARSNYTDAQGTTALGRNLRVAYLPYKGHSFEDAIVLSESGQRKLTSEHAYQHALDWDPQHIRGKSSYIGLFPTRYTRATLDNLDQQGIVKPGTIVHEGDPLILAARRREESRGGLHRKQRPSVADETLTWEHESPGIVTDVAPTEKGVNVVVKAYRPMEIADKLSGRYGDKGTISAIIPDDKAPHDKNGQPFDIYVNPLGLISRVNAGQAIEAALGKITEHTGRPYKTQDWGAVHDWRAFAESELAKHGLADTEDLYDPETGRKIPQVLTGNRFYMKLHHLSEDKGQGRGFGGYTSEGVPAKGGDASAKRLGLLESNAILSHGAPGVLRDAVIRGQESPLAWSQFMSGFNLPEPHESMVYDKLLHSLKAAGINVVRDGPRLHLMALTDKDVDALAEDRELGNAETVDWKNNLKPVTGGLFDPKLFGEPNSGHPQWAKISLHEPLPSPVFEEPIRRILGLTKTQFTDVLAGKQPFRGETGPAALQGALNRLDLPNELERARQEIHGNKKTARDAAIRRFGYLKDAQRLGIHPKDWILSKVPVLPLGFRPLSVMRNSGVPIVDDANFVYKELFDANQNLKNLSGQVSDVGEERKTLYNALRAVTGLGDPVHPKNVERHVKGILAHVLGSGPKHSVIQRKLLGHAVDLVGRAVAIPNPNLDMDHVGLPEPHAWSIYQPFIVRRLVRAGVAPIAAAQAVKDRSPDARKALLEEMAQRPVLINRAPTLHRYGILAAWPQLARGHALETSPLIVKGLNLDYDGDQMNFHVPVSDDAVREAVEKMLPSKNLFAVNSFRNVIHAPTQEYTGGLYEASSRIDRTQKPLVFRTKADAIRAYRSGEISADRQVDIMES